MICIFIHLLQWRSLKAAIWVKVDSSRRVIGRRYTPYSCIVQEGEEEVEGEEEQKEEDGGGAARMAISACYSGVYRPSPKEKKKMQWNYVTLHNLM